jgi:phytoene synthase
LAGERDWLAYFGRHGRSFRFAARLFPREASRRVAGVYAFCRFTDDLVDGPPSGDDPAALQSTLDTWLTLARRAHVGEASGIALLDEVVGGSGRAGVPFHFIHDLVEGVRMDVSPRTYRSLAELREYSYRVAGAVGGWLTELFGVHDPWVLERAFALGHAMQLTNILRDVGEDLNRGRLYLPLDRMARHGVDRELLQAMAAHRVPVFSGYRDLLEELMAEADADYQRALEAVPALPLFFRRPVAVAARVYQGIHDGIRRNAYDNLTRRAATSLPRKLWLGGSALLSLWRVASLATPDPRPLSFPSDGLGAEEGQEAAA